MSPRLSRDQSVVLALYEPSDGIDAIARDREWLARARALPAMVLRHGAMLTLEYLDAKVKDTTSKHTNLAVLLRRGLRAALPMQAEVSQGWPSTGDLAKMSPILYIAVQDAAVVVATWIKRLVDARAPREEGASRKPTGGGVE